MNKIYLIFIVACLTEQLKADIYSAELSYISEGDKSLATLSGDPKTTQIITFVNDVNKGDMKVSVTYLDFVFAKIYETDLSDPCDMDPSTEEGTLAAIFWKTLGIDSCSIKAGDYPTNKEKFNQTGIIEDTFEYVGELITITFEPKTQEDKKYFKLATIVHLVQEDS